MKQLSKGPLRNGKNPTRRRAIMLCAGVLAPSLTTIGARSAKAQLAIPNCPQGTTFNNASGLCEEIVVAPRPQPIVPKPQRRDTPKKECPVGQAYSEQYDVCYTPGNCFLTTACVDEFGLDDNCLELSTLRNLRNTHMMATAKGRKAVSIYSDLGPAILRALHPSQRRVFCARAYVFYILPCVLLARLQLKSLAVAHYVSFVRRASRALNSDELSRICADLEGKNAKRPSWIRDKAARS